MDYPTEFGDQARAEIEAERLRGIKWLAQRRKQVESRYQGAVEADEQNLRAYILRVFLAFVRQVCRLSPAWSVDRIRTEAEEFLRTFTIEAYYEQGYNRNGSKLPEMISGWTGGIKADVERKFRQSVEWRKYERQLLQAAKAQVNATIQPASRVDGERRPTERRAAVDAYIHEVLEKTGRRITRTDVWKKAGYKTRTEFERWERNDPKYSNKAVHENLTRILNEKPHLK